MPIENEVKFVLYDPRYELFDVLSHRPHRRQKIEQCYLKKGARIRKITEKQNGSRYVFTFKQPLENGSKIEIETAIDQSDFEALAATAQVGLEKERFKFEYDGVDWDIDFFLNGDRVYFVLAEAEMEPDRVSPDEIPPVLSPYVIYVVPRYEEKDYQNRRLAVRQYARQLLQKHLMEKS